MVLPAATAALGESPGAAGQPRAEDKPPVWILSSNNWKRGEGLLPDPVLERVKKGDYRLPVAEVDPERFRRNYSTAFWEASRRNAGRYTLAPELCGLADPATGKIPEFYFGLPFPHIDPADPRAGCKIAWNFSAATAQGEGGGATFLISGIDNNGEYRRIKASGDVMSYVGRHGGPIDNPDGMRSKAIVFVHEPLDVQGVSFLSWRRHDWTSSDLIWGFIPITRRVRRLSDSTRSDPIAGMDLYADDANCYAGKVEYFRWKLVGQGTVLAPVMGPYAFPMKPESPTRFRVEIPPLRAAFETPGAPGAPWQIVSGLVWVPRPVWLVEGEPTDPRYNFARIVFYFDREMYQIHWKLAYNRAGEYFYNAACGHHWAKTADGSFSAVANDIVIGVNDRTNRAAFGGRYTSYYVEREYEERRFSIPALMRRSD